MFCFSVCEFLFLYVFYSTVSIGIRNEWLNFLTTRYYGLNDRKHLNTALIFNIKAIKDILQAAIM